MIEFKTVRAAVRFAFDQNPEFIDLSKNKKANNELCKYIWECIWDYPVESILRQARILRNDKNSIYYRESSQEQSSKMETVYRSEFGEYKPNIY